jgi:hypothetical protein
MKKITRLAKNLQVILGEVADRAGEQSGLIQRKRKLTGSRFVQTLVLGKLGKPDASFEALSRTAQALGLTITAQGIEQRLGKEAAECLRLVLAAAVEEMLKASEVEIPLLKRFNGVYLQDSSVISLPKELIEVWQGCGGSNGESAGLKIQVEMCLSDGHLKGPYLQEGKDQDRSSSFQTAKLPKGSLLLRDLGYWSLIEMEKRTKRGEFWLFRVRARTNLSLADGRQIDVVDFLQQETAQQLDVRLHLGKLNQAEARLLAVRVPPKIAEERKRKLKEKARSKGQTLNQESLKLAEWYLLVTNVPEEKLNVREAIVLARARWQIELLFKLWKQVGKIDEWTSEKPFSILCDCYAKLLTMLIQHWILLTTIWQFPDRSLFKAAQTIQQSAFSMAIAFHSRAQLKKVLKTVCDCLKSGCKINSRSTRPNSYQLLLDPALLDWESLS